MITINQAFVIIRHYGKSFLLLKTMWNIYFIYLPNFYKTFINIRDVTLYLLEINVIFIIIKWNSRIYSYSKFIILMIISK